MGYTFQKKVTKCFSEPLSINRTIILTIIISYNYCCLYYLSSLSFIIFIIDKKYTKRLQNNETETKRRKPDLPHSMTSKVKTKLTLMDSSAYFTLQKKKKSKTIQNPSK